VAVPSRRDERGGLRNSRLKRVRNFLRLQSIIKGTLIKGTLKFHRHQFLIM